MLILNKLRTPVSKVFAGAFFAIIIFSFIVFFGPGGFDQITVSSGTAGWVNGEAVPKSRFDALVSDQLDRTPKGEGFDEKKALADAKNEVWKSLTDDLLWKQAAEDLGLRVSFESAKREILEEKNYQTDGQFDFEKYERWVHFGFHTNPRDFETELRRSLGARILRTTLDKAAALNDGEAFEQWLMREDKRSIEFIKTEPGLFPVTDPAEGVVDAWAAGREAELRKFHEDNIGRYRAPEKLEVAHILFQVANDAPPAAWEDARREAENMAKIATPANFADHAKARSDDPGSAANGGDLGGIIRGTMDPAFETAAFGLADGQISAPVKTTLGYHLIWRKGMTPAKNILFEQAKAEIARELWIKAQSREAAEAALRGFAKQAREENKKFGDLLPYSFRNGQPSPLTDDDKARAHAQVQAGELKNLTRSGSGFVMGIGAAKDLMDEAFRLTLDKPVSDTIFQSGDSLYMIRLLERPEPDQAKFFETDKDMTRRFGRWGIRSAFVDGYLAMKRQASTVTSAD